LPLIFTIITVSTTCAFQPSRMVQFCSTSHHEPGADRLTRQSSSAPISAHPSSSVARCNAWTQRFGPFPDRMRGRVAVGRLRILHGRQVGASRICRLPARARRAFPPAMSAAASKPCPHPDNPTWLRRLFSGPKMKSPER
jgi:hypothetical protein